MIRELALSVRRHVARVSRLRMDNDPVSVRAMRPLLKQVFSDIERRFEPPLHVSGVSFGFHELDQITDGLPTAGIVVVAALPSMGRTAFALSVARNVALSDTAVAIVSTHSDSATLTARLLSREARVEWSSVRCGQLTATNLCSLTAAAEELSQAPIAISDTPALTLTGLLERCRVASANARRQASAHPCLLVIEGLDELLERAPHRTQRELDLWGSLAALATELEVAILVTDAVDRALEERDDHRPCLWDLKSEPARHYASHILLVQRECIYQENPVDRRAAEIIVAKSPGQLAVPHTVWLDYDSRFGVFENLPPRREGRQ